MWNEVVDVKHKNIWDNFTSIWNKRGGGNKKGEKQGINICLIEKDSICREKVIILGFFKDY